MAAEPIRAPAGAVAWTTSAGFVYEEHEVPQHVAAGDLVLVVANDRLIRGVGEHDRAPLAAVVRLDAVVDDLVQRLDDVADRAEALDTSEAVDVSGMRSMIVALSQRVRQLEGGTS